MPFKNTEFATGAKEKTISVVLRPVRAEKRYELRDKSLSVDAQTLSDSKVFLELYD